MKKHWNKKGFTLSEVLIVVAIIVVLAGVGFIALFSHMRNMEQLELDGQAKEIFVAAQNHLALLDSQGYLDLKESGGQFGTPSTLSMDVTSDNKSKGVYYFVVNGSGSFTNDSVLKQILPFASIDEAARTSGSYIIRYQKDPAQILDVFYVDPNAKHGYAYTFNAEDYNKLYAETDGKSYANSRDKRRDCAEDLKKGAVMGYYGGVAPANLIKGKELLVPTVEVINAEVLMIKVTDNNKSGTSNYQAGNAVSLVIRGESSGMEISYDATGDISKILDDVNSSTIRIKNLDFIPGENLIVTATAYNNSVLTNIAQSAPQTTNSIFGDPTVGTTATITNIRHLINLDQDVSGVGIAITTPSGTSKIDFTKAKQTNDLDWVTFNTNLNTYTGSKMTAFPPVTPVSTLTEYDGGVYDSTDTYQSNHRISNIIVDCATDAGLFKSLTSCNVKNLTLEDFNIKTTAGNAGALAGTVSGSNITSVLVHNTILGGGESSTAVAGGDSSLKIEGSGAVGGLVGSISGTDVTVETSAAAVYVHSTSGAAGGLIGALASGSVTVDSSYAGGHTEDARYASRVAESGTSPLTHINILSETSHAGGLVGDASSASLTLLYSYSTASAASNKADSVGVGGLVGTSTSLTARCCYAAGLVDGNMSGSNKPSISPLIGIGSFAESGCSNVQYMSSVSPLATEPSGYSFVSAVSAGTSNEMMIPAAAQQTDAVPYDRTLALEYKGKYTYATVKQLGGKDVAGITDTHYGDWQVPQTSPLNYMLVNGNTLDLVVELQETTNQLTFAVTGAPSGVTRIFRLGLSLNTDVWTITSVTESAVSGSGSEVRVKDAPSFTNRFGTFAFDETTYSMTDHPDAYTGTSYPSYTSKNLGKRNIGTSEAPVYVYDVKISLDDITQADTHFAQLLSNTFTDSSDTTRTDLKLIPGENITVRLSAGDVSWSELRNIETSVPASEQDAVTDYATNNHTPKAYHQYANSDNSLFATSTSATLSTMSTAHVANIRHLQNLDISVSLVNQARVEGTNSTPAVTTASLDRDIAWVPDWNLHGSETVTKVYAFTSDDGYTACEDGKFNGIYCPYLTTFNGGNYMISGLQVGAAVGNSGAGNSGLFRLVTGTLMIKNLHLASPVVSTTSGYAGAVVAEVRNSGNLTLLTVLAEGQSSTVNGSGDTGGLVGVVWKDEDHSEAAPALTVSNSAASLLVRSTGGAAGGLLGKQAAGTVNIFESYAGGHTGYTDAGGYNGGKYYTLDNEWTTVETNGTRWNIVSDSGSAGGLIGEAASGSVTGIEKSFNAASVYSGATAGYSAGGIIGKAYSTIAAVSNVSVGSGLNEIVVITGASGKKFDLVYTVAPVNNVATYGFDADHLTVVLSSAGADSGTNGAAFGTLSVVSPPTNPSLYYMADIYENAKFNSNVTQSTIKAIGGGTTSMPVSLATYYAQDTASDPSSDIIAVLHHTTSTENPIYTEMQRLTTAYDSFLTEAAEGDKGMEYPFAIWTKFDFSDETSAEQIHFYGDWQPVENMNSTMFKFYFLMQDPENAAADGTMPLKAFAGETGATRMPIQLVPFRAVDLKIPTVPFIPGYHYGNHESGESSDDGNESGESTPTEPYWVWTVYYGNQSTVTSKNSLNNQVVDSKGAPLFYTEQGTSVKLENKDDVDIEKILKDAKSYGNSFTLVAHYYELPNQYTLRLMDYTPEQVDKYESFGSIQMITIDGETTSYKLSDALSDKQILIPRRNWKDYHFCGWYTQPDTLVDGKLVNNGQRVFYIDGEGNIVVDNAGDVDVAALESGSRHLTYYAHYEKIEKQDLTVKFILVDSDDNELPLGDGYTLSFDRNQGVDIDVTLPGTVEGVMVTKTMTLNGTESGSICNSSDIRSDQNAEAWFVRYPGSTVRDKYVHLKCTDKNSYPAICTVYISGSVDTVYYAVVHLLENTEDDDSSTDPAFKLGNTAKYSVTYVPYLENNTPTITADQYLTLAAFSDSDPSVRSIGSSSNNFETVKSTYSIEDSIGEAPNDKDVEHVFILTYHRNQHYLIFNNAGASDFDPRLTYYGETLTGDSGVLKTYDPEDWPGYTFIGWTLQDGTTAVPEKMPDENLQVRGSWTGHEVNYTVLVWLQNADDEKYTQKGMYTYQAPAGEILSVAESAIGVDISTNNSSTATQHVNLSDASAYTGNSDNDKKMRDFCGLYTYIDYDHSDTGREVKGDGSTVLNVYYKRNIYTIRFYIGFAKATGNNGRWSYTPVSPLEAINSHETYYRQDGNDYIPFTLEGQGVTVRHDFTGGYRYKVATDEDSLQYGIVNGNAELLTHSSEKYYRSVGAAIYRDVNRLNGSYTFYGIYNDNQLDRVHVHQNQWKVGSSGNNDLYSGAVYRIRSTTDNSNAEYTDRVYYANATKKAFSTDPPAGGATAYYGKISDTDYVVLTKTGGDSWTYGNGNSAYTGDRYLRIATEDGDMSYSYGLVDGELKSLLHDENGWYWESTSYGDFAGEVYLATNSNVEFYISTITNTDVISGANNHDNRGRGYAAFLTEGTRKFDGGFDIENFTGTEIEGDKKIYYFDLTARYGSTKTINGEKFYDKWPAQIFEPTGTYFVGWITPAEAWYWRGEGAPESSIKGKIDTMNWKIIDQWENGEYVNHPVSSESGNDYSIIFHCRYSTGTPRVFIYRQYLWDPTLGENGDYPTTPNLAYFVKGGSGSDPYGQSELEFKGYDCVAKNVYIDGDPEDAWDDEWDQDTNFPYSSNTKSFTVNGETRNAVEMEYKFKPHLGDVYFRFGSDASGVITGTGVSNKSEYYSQPLQKYATDASILAAAIAKASYAFEFEWYDNEACQGDPYFLVPKTAANGFTAENGYDPSKADSEEEIARKNNYNAQRRMPDGDLTLYAKMTHNPVALVFSTATNLLKTDTGWTTENTLTSSLPANLNANYSILYGKTLHEQNNVAGTTPGTLDIFDDDGNVLTAYQAKLPDAIANDYDFKGWYYEKETDVYERFSFVHTLKSDTTTTLYPAWAAKPVDTPRTITILYQVVDYNDDIVETKETVTANWKDANGNIMLVSDEQAAAESYQRIKDGDMVTIQAKKIAPYDHVDATGTIYYVSENDCTITLRYRDTSWKYNVEYWVLYENIPNMAGWLPASLTKQHITLAVEGADPGVIQLTSIGKENESAPSQYYFFDDTHPESELDLSKYTLHHFDFGKYETTGEGDSAQTSFTIGETSSAAYIMIHPEAGDTLRVYLSPDPEAITIPDLVTYYDSTDQTNETLHTDRNSADALSQILYCPEGATPKVIYEYYCYDKTSDSYVIADENHKVINAGTYGVRAYLTVKVGSTTYLLWQSDEGVKLGDFRLDENDAQKLKDIPPLHLYVQRRFVLIISEDADTAVAAEKAAYFKGGVLRREEIYYDSAPVATTSKLLSIYTNLGLYDTETSTFADGIGFVNGEGVTAIFSADAFRRNAGISSNVFSYKANTGTNLDNYSIFVQYGKLQVRKADEVN